MHGFSWEVIQPFRLYGIYLLLFWTVPRLEVSKPLSLPYRIRFLFGSQFVISSVLFLLSMQVDDPRAVLGAPSPPAGERKNSVSAAVA